jgi:hypothetical protein
MRKVGWSDTRNGEGVDRTNLKVRFSQFCECAYKCITCAYYILFNLHRKKDVSLEVLKAVLMKIQALCNVTNCQIVTSY